MTPDLCLTPQRVKITHHLATTSIPVIVATYTTKAKQLKNRITDKLYWRSCEVSRANGAISVLAVAETIVLSIGGIYLFTHSDWVMVSLTSMVVAFLMLFRSDQSVALGAEMFERYLEKETVSKPALFVIIFLAVLLAGGFFYWAATRWLVEYSGFALIWRAVIAFLIALNVGIAGAVALMLAAARSVVGAIIRAGRLAQAVLELAAVWGVSLAFGIYIRAISTRFFATLRYLKTGMFRFSENWTALNWGSDTFTPPELIPGLDRSNTLHFSGAFTWLKAAHAKQDSYPMIVGLLSLTILFTPTILYRWYLKSTAWLYYPLVWLAYVPKTDLQNGAPVWRKVKGTRKWETLFATLGFFGLLAFLFSITNFTTLIMDAKWPTDPVKTPTIILFLSHLDTDAIFSWKGAWKALLAFSSFLTLVLYLWADHINKNYEKIEGYELDAKSLRFIILLGQAKSFITVLWAGFSVGTFAFYIHSYRPLPDFLSGIFTYFWGDPCCIPML